LFLFDILKNIIIMVKPKETSIKTTRFITIFFITIFFVGLLPALCDDFESNGTADKYDLFYKNGRNGGSLEKVTLPNEALNAIFSVDLRRDENFRKAIDNSIAFYANILDSGVVFKYGEDQYTPLEMINSLVLFEELLDKDYDYSAFLVELNSMFNIYEAKNNKDKAVLTGYYTPHIDAFTKKTKLFRHPIIVQDDYSSKPLFYVKNENDIYNLKLEGAGVMELPDGSSVTVEYAGKKHIGKIKKVVQKQLKRVRYANAKGKKGTRIACIKRVVKVQKSIAYFKITSGGPHGWAEVPLIPKYTAAIDRDLAPMGGLMYIKSTEKFENADSVLTAHPDFKEFEGFMLAQDIGSAIKGGGRVDIYCGEGYDARNGANSIARIGSVYLIVAKKENLDMKTDRRAER